MLADSMRAHRICDFLVLLMLCLLLFRFLPLVQFLEGNRGLGKWLTSCSCRIIDVRKGACILPYLLANTELNVQAKFFSAVLNDTYSEASSFFWIVVILCLTKLTFRKFPYIYIIHVPLPSFI